MLRCAVLRCAVQDSARIAQLLRHGAHCLHEMEAANEQVRGPTSAWGRRWGTGRYGLVGG